MAYFATTTATAPELYVCYIKAVDKLDDLGFTVDFISMDGASSNRSFMDMLFTGNPRESLFTTKDTFDPSHLIVALQDIMHTFKKVTHTTYN